MSQSEAHPALVHAPQRYRPEIDGLRAVAILAVVLNHLSSRLLPGGYLGVDVFFVISGFVITGSLANRPAASLADLLLNFYSRRIRRLLPALLVCVLITAVVLCLVCPDPGQMLGVGWRSLVGSSNLILHKLALDYFRPATELNPFAQTWSLGVEEQFYLLFPLLVWFSGFARTGRSGQQRLGWLLLPLVLLSLGVFVHQLGVDQPAAYYLLRARFWELGTGCLLFLLLLGAPMAAPPDGPQAGGGPASRGQRPGGGSAAGFVEADFVEAGAWTLPPLLVLGALLLVMALPLPFGLVPVAAAVLLTALLLGSLRPGTAAAGLLSQPSLVFLGLISYSLYLWHWSVLALARWTVGISAASLAPLLALMLLLAVLSWRFVEEPLRRAPWWPERWRVLASGLALAAVGVIGLQALTRYGSEHLFRGDRQVGFYDLDRNGPAGDCSGPGHARLLLVGDSHAHHYQGAGAHLCRREGLAYAEAATVGMPYPPIFYTNPSTGMVREDAFRFALVQEQRWNALINNPAPPEGQQGVVVLSLRWPLYFDPGFLADASHARTRHFDPANEEPVPRKQALANWIDAVAQLVNSHPRTQFVLMLPTPEFGGSEPIALCQPQWFRPQLPRDCSAGLPRASFDRLNTYLQTAIAARLAAAPNLSVYNPLNALCPPAAGRCLRQRDGWLLYSDADHLSAYGASIVLDDLVAFLRQQQLLAAKPAKALQKPPKS